MSERSRWLWTLFAIATLSALAIVEAARAGHVGLLGLLCLVELVTLSLIWTLRSRAPVPIRNDLAIWLESTAAVTGESASDIADRAVSSYRAAAQDGDDP